MSAKLIVNIEQRHGTLAQFNAAVLPAGVTNQMWWITDIMRCGIIHTGGREIIGLEKYSGYHGYTSDSHPSGTLFVIEEGKNYKLGFRLTYELYDSYDDDPISGQAQFLGLVDADAGSFCVSLSGGGTSSRAAVSVEFTSTAEHDPILGFSVTPLSDVMGVGGKMGVPLFAALPEATIARYAMVDGVYCFTATKNASLKLETNIAAKFGSEMDIYGDIFLQEI